MKFLKIILYNFVDKKEIAKTLTTLSTLNPLSIIHVWHGKIFNALENNGER